MTETRLDDSVYDAEIFPANYAVLRQDRPGGRGGGVLLAVRQPYSVQRVVCDCSPEDEIVAGLVRRGGLCFVCCVIYLPCKVSDNRYFSVFKCLDSLLSKRLPVIVMGDFNLYSASQNVRDTYDLFISSCDLIQHNTVINGLGRLLDLVLSKSNQFILNITESEASLVTPEVHHVPLDIEITINKFRSRNVTNKHDSAVYVGRTFRNFKKASFVDLYVQLFNTDWAPVYMSSDTNEAVTLFYDLIYDVFNCTVPYRTNYIKKSSNYPAWYSSELITLLKVKKYYHTLYKVTKYGLYYAYFYYYRKKCKLLTAVCDRAHMHKIENNIKHNPRTFWSLIKSNRQSNDPSMFGKYSSQEVADDFATFFRNIYLTSAPVLNPCEAFAAAAPASPTSARMLSDRHITMNHVTKTDVCIAMKRLKPKYTQGPDGIPQLIVKDCREVLSGPLLHIIDLSLKHNVYPNVWKTSKVIPIHKSGSRSDIKNYRAVAVLSVFAKVMETVLYGLIYKQLKGWFCDEQHGFLPGRSTASNLMNITTTIANQLDSKGQVDVAYLDFQKAFDQIDCDVLLRKLVQAGFSEQLITFFSNYFTNRQQYVLFNQCQSQYYMVNSGVGQGSCLGPLLFLIMVNDLPLAIRHCGCLMFADDVKLAMTIRSEADCVLLQRDIDNVLGWGNYNSLHVNVDKCSIMSFTRNRKPVSNSYKIRDNRIRQVKSVKDLGTWFDTKLTFTEHVSKLSKASRKCLGFVLRQSKSFKDSFTSCLLFNAFVRSRLENNATVWNPVHHNHILSIEKIQKSFVRSLYNKMYGYYPLLYPTTFILGMVNYRTLEVRRNLALATYVFRLVRGISYNPDMLSLIGFRVPRINLRRVNSRQLFAIPATKSRASGSAPLPRALEYLNQILVFDSCLDIFVCSEYNFTVTAGRYLESMTRDSSVL